MPRTEDGEYELVLGNRQLLSIFFIVVVLLGVGFTLGYLLGRSSAPAAATTERLDAKLPETLVGDATPNSTPTPSPAIETRKPSPVGDAQSATGPLPAATVRQDQSAPPQGKPTTATIPPSTKYRTGPPPRGAVFIQVAAVPAADAEAEAEGLADKGYPIWVAPNERTAELFSVLVGPYTNKAELAKAKASLEKLGFRQAFRKEIR